MTSGRKQAAAKLAALTEPQLRVIAETAYLGFYYDEDLDVLRRGVTVDFDLVDELDTLFARMGIAPPDDSREKVIRERCLADAKGMGWKTTWSVRVDRFEASSRSGCPGTALGVCTVVAASRGEAETAAIREFDDLLGDDLPTVTAWIAGRVDCREGDEPIFVARDFAVRLDMTNSIEDMLVDMYEMAIEGLDAYDDEVRKSVKIQPFFDGRIGYRLVRTEIDGGAAAHITDLEVYYVPPGGDES